ncbi:ester cyclase [Stutzerimonas stutzeri]
MSRAFFMAAALLATSAMATAATPAARNMEAEEANRALVVKFYDQFFNKHQVELAARVVADDYKQHNPDVPDGKAPFTAYFAGFFKENPESRARIVRSATADDLVYLHVHSTKGPHDRGQAVIDIFRVDRGVIVEHWDVIQDVPAEAANGNTMF